MHRTTLVTMEALVTLMFLKTFSLTLGQLIVPQDIAMGQQQGTLMGLTQFGVKGPEVINTIASPQEILVENLAQSHHENQKNNVIKSKFPVAPTSDLLGVADVQNPKELTNQGKPPDQINKKQFAPLPLGVDFLSTSISSQEIVEMPMRASIKDPGPVSSGNSKSWKNLVKSNPRQVGDRFDIVIEKRKNGNELSPMKDASMKNANIFFNEPELPWLNAAVEQTPEHTWMDNTIVRSSIGPMEMAEVSTNTVTVRKKKINPTSNVNEIIKTAPATLLDVSSTPSPVDAMNSNPETHITNSFHLRTTDKQGEKPVTPSTTRGWTTWVEPVVTDTSPAWFQGHKITLPDIPIDEKDMTESAVNSLNNTTESISTKENKPTLNPFINEVPVELPTENELQKPQSRGFFSSWRPWTGKAEQTTNPNAVFTDSSNTGKHETVPVSSVSPPTVLENIETKNQDINSDLGNQDFNTELINDTMNTASGKPTVNPEIGKDVVNISPGKQTVNADPEIVNVVSNTATAGQVVTTEPDKQAISEVLVEISVNPEDVNQAANAVSLASATSAKVLGSPELLRSNALAQDVPKSQSAFDILKTNQKNAKFPASTTNTIVKENNIDKAEEETLPPTSNFDPLLLPPALSASDGHVFQRGKMDQTSSFHVQSGVSNTHMETRSLNNVLDHNDMTGGFPDLGRSGVSSSSPKRHFFVSPSPSDLIPPKEHLHEGILHPIEPHNPPKFDNEILNSPLHKGHMDMTNSLTGHVDITPGKPPLQPPSTGTDTDTVHGTHTLKSEVNANSIWSTRPEISGSTPAERIGSDQLSTFSDPAKERSALLKQINDVLVSLNGGKIKPLEGINPLSHETGLTHALIGRGSDFVDISRPSKEPIHPVHVGHTLTTTAGERARPGIDAMINKHETQHHLLGKHIDKKLFNDHNSLHKEHSLTDISSHITLDEKAIRQKLLSPDIASMFTHSVQTGHAGHAGHDGHHRHTGHNSGRINHMGLTDSLSGADVDLSQDLSKSPIQNFPITIRNLQKHIEETNRESAKLRFFKSPKTSKNVIKLKTTTSKSKRKEQKSEQQEIVVKTSQQQTTTATPSTTTEETDTLINTNSIFFDPDTHKPVDPFHNVSSDILRNAHQAWEHTVANIKTHIDPIPEIAAVVGDKKNAIRVGSVTSFRVGDIPHSMNQPTHDPNAAFHFLDPVTNAVVPIDAIPETSSNNHEHAPNPHLPRVPSMNQMLGSAMSNGENPTFPFINPLPSAGDINSDDGFFIGPVLFGPVDDPPPNGDIEINGPVLAMGISPGDKSKHGNHGLQGFDMKKIIEGIFKDDNQPSNTNKQTFNTHSTSSSSNHTATDPKRHNSAKTTLVKPAESGRIDINPLQQVVHGSKGKSMLPPTRFPVESSFRHSTSNHAREKVFHTPVDQSSKTQSRKEIPKTLWNALVNILKANKRKEVLPKQKVRTNFQKSFPSTLGKNNILQRPSQIQSIKPSKIDMQKMINLVKARQMLFAVKNKSAVPENMKQQHTRTGVSKSSLGGRSQTPNRSVIRPVSLTKHEPTHTRTRAFAPTKRPVHFQNNNYQLLLQLLKARRQFKQNHMRTNVPNVWSNMRSSHINSVARPAQRTIGHSSANAGRHSFIPKLNSAHRSSAMRPIPISTIHQWPFSAPVTGHRPAMNTQHFLPRHRVWPHNQLHYVTRHVFI